MTTIPADIREKAPLASISNRIDSGSLLRFQRRQATHRNVMTRHELGLHDLDGLDDDVTIDHYGPPTSRSIDDILVPVAGGPNTDAVLGLARNLASNWNASLTLLTVLPGDADTDRRHTAEDRLEDYANTLDEVRVETRLETGDDIAGIITALTDRFELVVIGDSDQSLFQRFFYNSIPERLEKNTRAPIFAVRR